MKTAKEFWNYSCKNEELKSPSDILIEFAKMHVQAALKAASKNAMGVHCTDYIDPDSILDAYPLTNIK